MYHNVFHIGKVALDSVVYALRDLMSCDQRDVSLDGDLEIHIYLVAELPRVQQVDVLHDVEDIPGKVGDMVHKVKNFKVYPNASVTFSYRLF